MATRNVRCIVPFARDRRRQHRRILVTHGGIFAMSVSLIDSNPSGVVVKARQSLTTISRRIIHLTVAHDRPDGTAPWRKSARPRAGRTSLGLTTSLRPSSPCPFSSWIDAVCLTLIVARHCGSVAVAWRGPEPQRPSQHIRPLLPSNSNTDHPGMPTPRNLKIVKNKLGLRDALRPKGYLDRKKTREVHLTLVETPERAWLPSSQDRQLPTLTRTRLSKQEPETSRGSSRKASWNHQAQKGTTIYIKPNRLHKKKKNKNCTPNATSTKIQKTQKHTDTKNRREITTYKTIITRKSRRTKPNTNKKNN